MRTFLLSFVLLTVLFSSSFAQINAGDIPPGASTTDPGINLSISTNMTSDSSYLDIDCDGNDDIQFMLNRANTSIDWPNTLVIHNMNGSFEICASINTSVKTNFYNLSDPISCTGAYDWSTEATVLVGNYGTFGAVGPFSVTDQYIAYRKVGTSDIGWIKLSFDLEDSGSTAIPVTLDISEMIRLCDFSSVDETASTQNVRVTPNPSNGWVSILSETPVENVRIFAASGTWSTQTVENNGLIRLPDVPGIYFLQIKTHQGTITRRVIRQPG